MGVLASVAGALAYGALLRRYSNFDSSVITVLIGFVVGRVIRAGAGHRASRALRVLAVVLTYGAIAGAYIAVRGAFLFNDGQAFSLGALRPFDLVVLPIVLAARDWLLAATYILALIAAWCACGKKVPAGLMSRRVARLSEDP
jgi:hypothetical protein